MASFNKVILIGNLVADPELKQTPNGIYVTSFRIAVGRRIIKQGENPQTDFIDIICWRKTAEFAAKYFNKGKSILVCGSLQTRTWTDNNGTKRYAVEVVADEVSFVERKSESNGNTYTDQSSVSSGYEDLDPDDELPF